jgi:hypothetical protein
MLARLDTQAASEWRRGWVKVGVGVLAGAALGGGVVYADGGDPSQVHACVNSTDEGRPNVIIVDPNDGCPSGYSPRHWSIQGPKGDPGPQGPSAQEDPVAAPPADLLRFENRISRGVGKKKPRKVERRSGLSNVAGKVVDAKCGGLTPRLVGGTFSARRLPPPEDVGFIDAIFVDDDGAYSIYPTPAFNGPIGPSPRLLRNTWRVAAFVGGGATWELKVTAFCVK